MKLVNVRARAMSAAATNSHTGMSAVLGGERDVVIAALASLGLTAANENGAGQIVAAGDIAALEKLAENPPEGSRVRPLAVSGAFHTSVMNPAVSALQAAASAEKISDGRIPVLSNRDGAIVSSGSDLIARIVGQVAGPVRWDLCMKTLADSGVTGVIEVAPGGTLVGLLKRAEPSIQTFALKTPEDISGARAFAKEHGGK
jgi:[acyl-carrier-protein] S-malonyltransferase